MKKGYTLVELLGVIIILTLITMLVLPNVINSIKNSSSKNDDLMEELIISASKTYIDDNYYDMLIGNGFTLCIPLTELVEKDYLTTPIKYKNMDDITGIKVVKVTYSDKYTYNIVDKSTCSYLVVQNEASDNFLNTDILKSDIEQINIVNNMNIPNNSLGDFDVSSLSNNTIILWYTDNNLNNKYEVYIGSNGNVIANSNSRGLFSDLTNLLSINLNYLDTSKVINTGNMFYNTPNLNELTINGCNFNNVITSEKMFYNTNNSITVRISSNNSSFIRNNLTNSNIFFPNIIQSN